MIVKKIVRKLGLNLNQAEDFGIVNPQVVSKRIPKIIHQTYFTKELAPEIELNIQKLKSENPEWEYRFYDDNDIEEYITKYYPEIVNLYKRINSKYGAARADLFRYLVIYKEGGVYLDIKSSTSKPLNEIIKLDDQFILAHWSVDVIGKHIYNGKILAEFQQWHVISVSGHPYLKAVIENVCRNIKVYNVLFHESGWLGVLKLTGPIAYSLAILPILNQHQHRIGIDQEFGLVYSIYGNNFDKHRELFKTHYLSLKESIVEEPKLIKSITPIVLRLKNIIKSIIF